MALPTMSATISFGSPFSADSWASPVTSSRFICPPPESAATTAPRQRKSGSDPLFLQSVARNMSRRSIQRRGFAPGRRTPKRHQVRLLPILLNSFISCPRKKSMATITAIAMTAMMSAYSTRPWPESSRQNCTDTSISPPGGAREHRGRRPCVGGVPVGYRLGAAAGPPRGGGLLRSGDELRRAACEQSHPDRRRQPRRGKSDHDRRELRRAAAQHEERKEDAEDEREPAARVRRDAYETREAHVPDQPARERERAEEARDADEQLRVREVDASRRREDAEEQVREPRAEVHERRGHDRD